MYRVLARTRVAVNRHGDIAEGYANNMRLFEATGDPVVRPVDRNRVRHHPRLLHLVLAVLHDQRAAGTGVVEQPRVVGDQRRLRFIGARPDDDRGVAAQVDLAQRGGIEPRDREAELLERRCAVVPDTLDVSDAHIARRRHIDRLDRQA